MRRGSGAYRILLSGSGVDDLAAGPGAGPGLASRPAEHPAQQPVLEAARDSARWNGRDRACGFALDECDGARDRRPAVRFRLTACLAVPACLPPGGHNAKRGRPPHPPLPLRVQVCVRVWGWGCAHASSRLLPTAGLHPPPSSTPACHPARPPRRHAVTPILCLDCTGRRQPPGSTPAVLGVLPSPCPYGCLTGLCPPSPTPEAPQRTAGLLASQLNHVVPIAPVTTVYPRPATRDPLVCTCHIVPVARARTSARASTTTHGHPGAASR